MYDRVQKTILSFEHFFFYSWLFRQFVSLPAYTLSFRPCMMRTRARTSRRASSPLPRSINRTSVQFKNRNAGCRARALGLSPAPAPRDTPSSSDHVARARPGTDAAEVSNADWSAWNDFVRALARLYVAVVQTFARRLSGHSSSRRLRQRPPG